MMDMMITRTKRNTLMPVLLSLLLFVNLSGSGQTQAAHAATGTLRGA
jgi:hypothetical protein